MWYDKSSGSGFCSDENELITSNYIPNLSILAPGSLCKNHKDCYSGFCIDGLCSLMSECSTSYSAIDFGQGKCPDVEVIDE